MIGVNPKWKDSKRQKDRKEQRSMSLLKASDVVVGEVVGAGSFGVVKRGILKVVIKVSHFPGEWNIRRSEID